ncbi:MAG: four helix bundle protein [Flavobacteriales bacterium]|nr:four helix bundle protein [Flavobacteriales bacterium]
MRNDRKNLIVDLTFQFALKVVEFADELDKGKKFRLANQLFGCGTSIGANVREAQNAESRADFIHKMKLAAKETDETIYWLELCSTSRVLPTRDDMLAQAVEISKVLSKIISTSKKV